MEKPNWGCLTTLVVILALTLAFWYGVYKIVVDLVT